MHREAEDEILPACARLGIGQLPFFPLASGLLTGKYTRGEQATEGRLAGREIPEEQFDRVEALQRFADERGVSLLEVAIGGLLAMPAVTSVIAGATKPEQVRANVKAGAWEPSPDDVAALTALGVDSRGRGEAPQACPLGRQIEAEQREHERIREHEQERRGEAEVRGACGDGQADGGADARDDAAPLVRDRVHALRVERHPDEEHDVRGRGRDRRADHSVARHEPEVEADVHRRADAGHDPVELRPPRAAAADREHRVAGVDRAGEREQRDALLGALVARVGHRLREPRRERAERERDPRRDASRYVSTNEYVRFASRSSSIEYANAGHAVRNANITNVITDAIFTAAE